MRTTADPDSVDQRPRMVRLDQLRRVLAHRAHVGPTTPSRQAGHPTMRRVWREVARGEWRWLHVPDQAVPK